MNSDFIPFAVILGFIMIVIIVFNLPTIDRINRIRKTPASWISALPAEGQVKVEGTVEPISPSSWLRSPIGQDDCVFWQLDVSEPSTRGKGGWTTWHTVIKRNSSEPFIIKDETGWIAANPSGAFLHTRKMEEHSQDTFSGSLPPDVEATLKKFDVGMLNWLGMKKTMRVRERVICPGDHIIVYGEIGQMNGQKALYLQNITDQNEQELSGDLSRSVFLTIYLPVIILIIVIVFWILSISRQ
jgi:hypothetical protein